MKDKGDFHVLLEDHLKALQLNNEQREAATDILVDADALEDRDGEMYISVRAYTDYILIRLDELSLAAKRLQSFKDLENYESITRRYLHEFAFIIGNLSHHMAKEHRFESVDESVKALEGLIADLRKMFEHVVEANKLFVEFARGGSQSNER